MRGHDQDHVRHPGSPPPCPYDYPGRPSLFPAAPAEAHLTAAALSPNPRPQSGLTNTESTLSGVATALISLIPALAIGGLTGSFILGLATVAAIGVLIGAFINVRAMLVYLGVHCVIIGACFMLLFLAMWNY